MERVCDLAAGATKLRCGGQEGIADRDNRGRCDRLLEPLAALLSPTGDEGAVAELSDGDGGEEDLVAGHETDLGLEAGASASADGRAEDAGVDEDPHHSSAAVKASSSSSESSSINSESIESSTGPADPEEVGGLPCREQHALRCPECRLALAHDVDDLAQDSVDLGRERNLLAVGA